MRIWVLCNIHTDWTGEHEEFSDVTVVEKVVVIWAEKAVKANQVGYVSCKVYDDVGLYEGKVDLKKTAQSRRIVMVM